MHREKRGNKKTKKGQNKVKLPVSLMCTVKYVEDRTICVTTGNFPLKKRSLYCGDT